MLSCLLFADPLDQRRVVLGDAFLLRTGDPHLSAFVLHIPHRRSASISFSHPTEVFIATSLCEGAHAFPGGHRVTGPV
jgi:hypothetical protein